MKMIDKPFGKINDFKMMLKKSFYRHCERQEFPKTLCDTFKYRKSNLVSTIRLHEYLRNFLFLSILFYEQQ